MQHGATFLQPFARRPRIGCQPTHLPETVVDVEHHGLLFAHVGDALLVEVDALVAQLGFAEFGHIGDLLWHDDLLAFEVCQLFDGRILGHDDQALSFGFHRGHIVIAVVAQAARRVVARARHHQVEAGALHPILQLCKLAHEHHRHLGLDGLTYGFGQTAVLLHDSGVVGAARGAFTDAQHKLARLSAGNAQTEGEGHKVERLGHGCTVSGEVAWGPSKRWPRCALTALQTEASAPLNRNLQKNTTKVYD